jgi:hypothetical protein
MSVQQPVAPHRVAIADIDIPFWRMVAIMIKWTLAAIPAFIVISIIFGIIGAAFGLLFGGMMGGMMGKWM